MRERVSAGDADVRDALLVGIGASREFGKHCAVRVDLSRSAQQISATGVIGQVDTPHPNSPESVCGYLGSDVAKIALETMRAPSSGSSCFKVKSPQGR